MRILYITALTPYGTGESFILPEVRALRRLSHEVTIVPIRPGRDLAPGVEPEGHLRLPLLGLKTLALAALELLAHPAETVRTVGRVLKHSQQLSQRLKNLVVVPKGLATARLIRNLRPDHVHVHWASTPSTVAYVAACQTGVPYSFTAHRWDITENNMIAEKGHLARFVRAISETGQAELRDILLPGDRDRCRVIHMGVEVPAVLPPAHQRPDRIPVIACPANLVLKKGHTYLIEACRTLRDRGVPFACWLMGEGPLAETLRQQVDEAGLAAHVVFKGHLPHADLLELYRDNRIDVVVLPSIRTDTLVPEEEGIPVSLMEAMAAGIPVVSTATGGIPELLDAGAGIIVEPAQSAALAVALENLLTTEASRIALRNRGFERIRAEFSLEVVADTLSRAFAESSVEGANEPGSSAKAAL